MKMHSLIREAETAFENLEKVDLYIGACGYESRSTTVFERLKARLGDTLCFGFSEFAENPVRKKSQAIFEGGGCCVLDYGGSDFIGIYDAVRVKVGELSAEAVVAVDISSMTRTWSGAVTKALFDCDSNLRMGRSFTVFFLYAPAQYSAVVDPYPPNKIVGPVSGFSALGLPDKPTSLVLGLGQQTGRALGLVDHVDPGHVVLFCPIPGIEPRYDEDLLENNREVIETYASSTYEYPLADPYASFKMLESVVVGLGRESNIVLSSLGPKIFSLYCFLLSAHYRDLSVWRATAAERELPVDRKADGRVLHLGVLFRCRDEGND